MNKKVRKLLKACKKILYSPFAPFRKIYTDKYMRIQRSRLKNSNFTIIADSCVAGIIYQYLGMEYLSPTIGLWMNSADYAKFALNFDEYINMKLTFEAGEIPEGLLGDVHIHFLHYKNQAEAAEKWERRKKRINRDNLFFIFDDRYDFTDDEIKQIENLKCAGKIMLCKKINPKINMKQIVISGCDENGHLGDYLSNPNMFTGMRKFEKMFDYVEWLNKDK